MNILKLYSKCIAIAIWQSGYLYYKELLVLQIRPWYFIWHTYSRCPNDSMYIKLWFTQIKVNSTSRIQSSISRYRLLIGQWHPNNNLDLDDFNMIFYKWVWQLPTCWAASSRSFVWSPSFAAVLPNSLQFVALCEDVLGSLDFLENRLLKEKNNICVNLWNTPALSCKYMMLCQRHTVSRL